MIQHVSDRILRKTKTVLWTPWGSQTVPDLDRALETSVKRAAPKNEAALRPRRSKAKPS